jgi:hypothetical protein
MRGFSVERFNKGSLIYSLRENIREEIRESVVHAQHVAFLHCHPLPSLLPPFVKIYFWFIELKKHKVFIRGVPTLPSFITNNPYYL